MKKIKIILVEDQRIVRFGLISLFRDIENISVIGDVENATELFKLLKSELPDVIITDIQLPGMSGIEIIKILKKDFPTIKVLILSGSYNESIVFQALKAGTNGFLSKNVTKDELVNAIETLDLGEDYYSAKVKDIILKNYLQNARDGEETSNHENLSYREREVLKYLAIGHSINETADLLCLSYSTIVSHKTKIMHKLNVKSNVDLVRYALKNNMVDL